MIETMAEPTVTYPAAPWVSRGGAWVGLFTTDKPVPLPRGLTHLLGSRTIVVALIRYLQGTLQYDELIVGSYARHNLSIGLFVHHIWVDDVQSLWGGRRIWGLNKQLATFDWSGNTVRITDDAGPILSLQVDPRTAWLPRLPLPVPVFGQHDDRWLFAVASASARIGGAGMQLSEWSSRFGYRIGGKPFIGVGMKPFRMSVPAPDVLSTAAPAP